MTEEEMDILQKEAEGTQKETLGLERGRKVDYNKAEEGRRNNASNDHQVILTYRFDNKCDSRIHLVSSLYG